MFALNMPIWYNFVRFMDFDRYERQNSYNEKNENKFIFTMCVSMN